MSSVADGRAGVVARAVSVAACKIGVSLKDRPPIEVDAPDLVFLAGQCLELAGHLDQERGEIWTAFMEDLVQAAVEQPLSAAVQPAAAIQRRHAA